MAPAEISTGRLLQFARREVMVMDCLTLMLFGLGTFKGPHGWSLHVVRLHHYGVSLRVSLFYTMADGCSIPKGIATEHRGSDHIDRLHRPPMACPQCFRSLGLGRENGRGPIK